MSMLDDDLNKHEEEKTAKATSFLPWVKKSMALKS